MFNTSNTPRTKYNEITSNENGTVLNVKANKQTNKTKQTNNNNKKPPDGIFTSSLFSMSNAQVRISISVATYA